jgi:Co/Zn/Cd efflux system component
LDPVFVTRVAIVFAPLAWSLLRATGAFLLDLRYAGMAAALNDRIGAIPGLRLADLHVWRVGPQARAAIVEVEGEVTPAELRRRLADLRDVAHLTVAIR